MNRRRRCAGAAGASRRPALEPLPRDVRHLRLVDAAGEVDPAAAAARERAEDRRRGEHRRADATRRRASPIACAIRCERSSPWPGVNQTRIPSCQTGSTNPLPPPCRRGRAARSRARTRPRARASRRSAITFSCRDQASSVQFVEPVQTDSPSRITYLWCIRSGTPAIGIASSGSERSAPRPARRRRHGDRVRVVDVVGKADVTPRAAARRIASPTTRRSPRRGRSRTGRGRASAGAVEERRDAAAISARTGRRRSGCERDQGVHRASRRRQDRRDVQLLPRRRAGRRSCANGSSAISRSTGRRHGAARRRGARLPRRSRLRDAADLGAAAERHRAGRGDRNGRPCGAGGARARGARRPPLERRPDASRRRSARTGGRAACGGRRRARSTPASSRGAGRRRSRSAGSPSQALGGAYVRHPAHGGAAEFRRGLAVAARLSHPACYHRGGERLRSPIFRTKDLLMKTYSAKTGEITREWYLVDAEGQTLGRLATQIADRLRGKGKPQFTPHVDTGDFVVVVNAEKIAVTGNKLDEKIYYRHSGYPGGLQVRPLREQLERRPDRGAAQGGQGHASAQQARPPADHEAEDLRRPRASARGPGAEAVLMGSMADAPVPRHRQAQDLRRPRDPASRRRQDVDQRQDDRDVLPAAHRTARRSWRR